MEKQKVFDLMQYLSQNEKESSLGIFYSLELLDTKLKDAIEDIKKDLQKVIQENRFDEVEELTAYCKEIERLQAELASCLDSMIAPSPMVKKVIEDARDKPPIVDYSKYTVDRREAHSLAEDFEYRRICAFKVNRVEFEVDSWKDTLLKFCGLLAKQDSKLIESFMFKPDLCGRKIRYFQKSSVLGRNQIIPGTDIYVWTNMSANEIVRLIKKMLKYAKISPADFQVFLRADYSGLHKKD